MKNDERLILVISIFIFQEFEFALANSYILIDVENSFAAAQSLIATTWKKSATASCHSAALVQPMVRIKTMLQRPNICFPRRHVYFNFFAVIFLSMLFLGQHLSSSAKCFYQEKE